MRVKIYYLVCAGGFAASSVATWLGAGPDWPNRVTFGALALVASVSTIAFVTFGSEASRRLMVGSVVIASCARAIGWAATTEATVAFRIGAAGSLLPLAALMLIVNQASRKGM